MIWFYISLLAICANGQVKTQLTNKIGGLQNNIAVVDVIGMPDTVDFYDKFDFTILIQNQDSLLPYMGILSVSFITDYMQTLSLPSSLLNVDTTYIYTIGPNQTDTIFVKDQEAHPSRYKSGDNTVLIWPNNSKSTDTTDKKIYVRDSLTTTIASWEIINSNFTVYPMPFKDEFQICSQETFESVIILDVLGKVKWIGKPSHPEDVIKIPLFEAGMYFIQLELKNQQTISRKVFITDK